MEFKKIVITVSEDKRREIKIMSAKMGMTMREFLDEALHHYFAYIIEEGLDNCDDPDAAV